MTSTSRVEGVRKFVTMYDPGKGGSESVTTHFCISKSNVRNIILVFISRF